GARREAKRPAHEPFAARDVVAHVEQHAPPVLHDLHLRRPDHADTAVEPESRRHAATAVSLSHASMSPSRSSSRGASRSARPRGPTPNGLTYAVEQPASSAGAMSLTKWSPIESTDRTGTPSTSA